MKRKDYLGPKNVSKPNKLPQPPPSDSGFSELHCSTAEDCMSMTFDKVLQQAVQHTVIDFIRKGEWMKMDYNARVNIDSAWLREMHSRVSMDSVMKLVKAQVEQRIADGIINAMTTEIATDVKSIMCNKELREDLRAILRAKIREAQAAVSAR